MDFGIQWLRIDDRVKYRGQCNFAAIILFSSPAILHHCVRNVPPLCFLFLLWFVDLMVILYWIIQRTKCVPSRTIHYITTRSAVGSKHSVMNHSHVTVGSVINSRTDSQNRKTKNSVPQIKISPLTVYIRLTILIPCLFSAFGPAAIPMSYAFVLQKHFHVAQFSNIKSTNFDYLKSTGMTQFLHKSRLQPGSGFKYR